MPAVRLLHGGVAIAVGAADALVTANVKQMGPGGIPFPVYLEAGAIVLGLVGDKVGVPSDARDALLISGLALGGARLTRVAAKGSLMAGPKAWGGDFTGDPGTGGAPSQQIPARPGVRLLPSRAQAGGGFGIYPATQEASGIAG